MKTSLKDLEGSKITHFRYKLKDDKVVLMKLYLKDRVLKLYSSSGLIFDKEDLLSFKGKKISEFKLKIKGTKYGIRIHGKNKKIKIDSPNYIVFSY